MRTVGILTAWLLSVALHGQTVAVVQEGPGKVVVFPARDPSHQTAIPVGDKPHEIEMTPDGRVAYVSNFGLLEANHKIGTPGTTISVLDLQTLTERTRFKLPDGFTAPHGLKLRPPKYQELFTNTEEHGSGMVVFNAESGAVLRTFVVPHGVHNFVFSPDGSSLFAFTMTGKICRISPDNGKVSRCADAGSPRGLSWTADHRYLILSGKDEILLLDPVSLGFVKRIEKLDVGQIFYTAATPDGHWLFAPAVLDGMLLAIDASTGTVEHRIETGSPLMLALDSDGKHAWVSNVLVPAGFSGPQSKGQAGGVSLLDLTTFTVTPIPGIADTNGVAISSQ